MYRTAIGKRIVNLRERKGWTQEKLGLKADVTSTAIGLIERGVSKRPHTKTLAKLYLALDVTDEVPEKEKTGQGYHGTKSRISYQPQLGERIELLRKQKGWSKAVLAEKSGVHYSSMNRVILQRSKYMLPVKIEKIAKALGVPVEHLKGETNVDTRDVGKLIVDIASDLTFKTVTHLTDSVKEEYRKGFIGGAVIGAMVGVGVSFIALFVIAILSLL